MLSQSVQLLLIFFCFKSSIQIFIRIATAFFALLFFSLYIFLLFSFLILFHAFFASFFSFILPCTSSFHDHVSLSSFHISNVTPSTVLALVRFSVVLSHSLDNPLLPPQILVTSCLNAS